MLSRSLKTEIETIRTMSDSLNLKLVSLETESANLKMELDNRKKEEISANKKVQRLESEAASYKVSLREHEVLKQMIPTLENQFNNELEHLQEINRQTIFKIRQAHDLEVEELKKKYEADLISQEEKSVAASLGSKLKQQVALSKELDQQLFNEMTKNRNKYGLKFECFQESLYTEFGKIKELVGSKLFQVCQIAQIDKNLYLSSYFIIFIPSN